MSFWFLLKVLREPSGVLTYHLFLQRLRAERTKQLSNKDATKRETKIATDLIDKLSLGAEDEKVM